MLNKGYRYSKAQALANYYADVRNTANFAMPQGPGGLARIPGMRYGTPTMGEAAANRSMQEQVGRRRLAWHTLRRDPRARAQALGALGGAALAGGAIGGAAGYYAGQEDEQY